MGKNRRLNKEIQNMMKDNDLNKNNYCIEILEDDNNHLEGKIMGAVDTPFQFGIFVIDVKIPDKYPFEPPVCKFITKLWHPNISSQTGVICLDILKDKWAAAMTLESVFVSLQSFLSTPVPDDPQDEVVAAQYRTDRNQYNKTAKYWTFTYAVEESLQNRFNTNEFKDFEEKIKKFVSEKKSNREVALQRLSNCHWDLNRALN